MVGFAGLSANHPVLIPHEFPLLPVAEGCRLLPQLLGAAFGYVVGFAIADVLAPELPNVACPDVTPVPGSEDAANGPLLIVALAV